MKIVLPGGTGQIGAVLGRAFSEAGHDVVVLSRTVQSRPGIRGVRWDGRTPGTWSAELDGSDVVINLAGRSVSCRYTLSNLREMMGSRVDSTRAVGQAIEAAGRPPKVWLQMSTATIYAHTFDRPNDESTGTIGGSEPGVPDYWAFSVEIAKAWELAQDRARTPETRKVSLRTAMVMSPSPGGTFDVLSRMARVGLGGPVAGGRQFVSWLHETDNSPRAYLLAAGVTSRGHRSTAWSALPTYAFARSSERPRRAAQSAYQNVLEEIREECRIGAEVFVAGVSGRIRGPEYHRR